MAASFSINAACLEGRPSIDDELRTSTAVAVITPTKMKYLQEDLEDPIGITATLYTLRLDRVLRGRLPQRFHIRDENTSSRFPMAIGVPYLAFVYSARNGYGINSCGNSGPLKERNRVLKHLLDIKEESKHVR